MVLCWQPSITPSTSASQPCSIQANSIARRAAGHSSASWASSPVCFQVRCSRTSAPIWPSAAAVVHSVPAMSNGRPARKLIFPCWSREWISSTRRIDQARSPNSASSAYW